MNLMAVYIGVLSVLAIHPCASNDIGVALQAQVIAQQAAITHELRQ